MAKERRKTGTREWATHNLNIATGCPHGCRYCYARKSALRFKRVPDAETWRKRIVVDQAKVTKNYGKRKGNIMFPTAHDIVPEILDGSVAVLTRVLQAGNDVLIVSKPHLECIERLCADLWRYKDKVTFRFTIGDSDPVSLAFWEPGAPSFEERLAALQHAAGNGWRTSVSMEPMLSTARLDDLIEEVEEYVNETIRIGKMNKVGLRCMDVPPEVVAAFEAQQDDETVLSIVETWRHHPKVQWKDSIKEVIERRT